MLEIHSPTLIHSSTIARNMKRISPHHLAESSQEIRGKPLHIHGNSQTMYECSCGRGEGCWGNMVGGWVGKGGQADGQVVVGRSGGLRCRIGRAGRPSKAPWKIFWEAFGRSWDKRTDRRVIFLGLTIWHYRHLASKQHVIFFPSQVFF